MQHVTSVYCKKNHIPGKRSTMIYITNDRICKRWSMKTKLMEITYGFSFAQFKPISCLISASVTYSSAALKGKRVFSAAFRKSKLSKFALKERIKMSQIFLCLKELTTLDETRLLFGYVVSTENKLILEIGRASCRERV